MDFSALPALLSDFKGDFSSPATGELAVEVSVPAVDTVEILGLFANKSLISDSLVCAAALPLSSWKAFPYAWLAIFA